MVSVGAKTGVFTLEVGAGVGAVRWKAHFAAAHVGIKGTLISICNQVWVSNYMHGVALLQETELFTAFEAKLQGGLSMCAVGGIHTYAGQAIIGNLEAFIANAAIRPICVNTCGLTSCHCQAWVANARMGTSCALINIWIKGKSTHGNTNWLYKKTAVSPGANGAQGEGTLPDLCN